MGAGCTTTYGAGAAWRILAWLASIKNCIVRGRNSASLAPPNNLFARSYALFFYSSHHNSSGSVGTGANGPVRDGGPGGVCCPVVIAANLHSYYFFMFFIFKNFLLFFCFCFFTGCSPDLLLLN